MKHSKKLATLAILFALVGCGGTSDKPNNSGNSTPSISVQDQDAAYLEQMKGFLIYDGLNTVGVTGDFDLTTSLDNGKVTVTYVSDNTTNLVVEDGKAKVTRPAAGSTDTGYALVTLTATLSYNGKTTEKVFYVKVLEEMEGTTIADIHAATDVAAYEVTGTVTGVNARGFTLYDGTGQILVYLNSQPAYQVGDYLKVSGTTTTYKQDKNDPNTKFVYQFDKTAVITKLSGAAPSKMVFDFSNPTRYEAADIEAWEAAGAKTGPYVTIRGILEVDGSYLNVKIDGTELVGSIKYPMASSNFAAHANKVVDVTGILLSKTVSSSSGKSFVDIMGVKVEEAALTADQKLAAAKELVTLPETVADTLDLPTTGEYGAAITWESSNTEVISIVDGVVTVNAGTTAVEVTLTAKIALEGLEATKEIKVTVLPADLEPTHTVTTLKTITEDVEAVIVEGTVFAVNTKGYFLTDGTNTIQVYLNATPAVNNGDKVLVQLDAKVDGQYGIQGTNAVVLKAVSTGNAMNLTPVAYTFDELYDASKSKQVLEQSYVNEMVGTYVEVDGYILQNSYGYYNLYQENNTSSSQMNIMNTNDANLEVIKANLGVKITLKAFVYGFSKGKDEVASARFTNLVFESLVNNNPVNPDTPDTPETPVDGVLVDGTINNTIPAGFTYISNDPVKYPNPQFYKDGGLKMNFYGMAVETDQFVEQTDVDVVLNVLALNNNQKTEVGTDVPAFTIVGLDVDGNVVATAELDTVAKGENTVNLKGNGIVKVKVTMTDWPNLGTVCANVSLGGVKVVSNAEVTPEPEVANLFVATEWVESDEKGADDNDGAQMVYWADHPDWGNNTVINVTASSADDTYTLQSELVSGNIWYALQVFCSVPDMAAGDTYNVSFTLNSTVAGKITVNGVATDIVVGDNEITYTKTVAASTTWDGKAFVSAPLTVQFGVEGAEATANAAVQTATYVFSNIVIEKVVA